MSDNIIHVSDDSFEQEVLQSEMPVLIDYWAEWCGPCKMIAPMIQEMSESMDNVVFLKVDVDENEESAAEYNISAMPTFVFIKKGAKIADMMGANAEKLKAMVAEHSA